MLEKKKLTEKNLVSNKLWLNIFAGIMDIVIFSFGTFIIVFPTGNIINEVVIGINFIFLEFTLKQVIFISLAIVSIVIHIFSFMEANNNGVYNVGNILGITAGGLMIFKLGIFKLFPLMVYFIAALFSLIQKKTYL